MLKKKVKEDGWINSDILVQQVEAEGLIYLKIFFIVLIFFNELSIYMGRKLQNFINIILAPAG